MAEVQSLGALKAQNAREAGEEAEESAVSEVEAEATEVDQEADSAVDETIDEAPEDSDEDTDESEDIDTELAEAWQASEEQDSEGQSRLFTASEIARARRKERAKVEKRAEDELARLREENEALKAGKRPPAPAPSSGFSEPRPRREDFPYGDDAAYDAAMDAWQDRRLEAKLSAIEQQRHHQQAESAATRALSDAVQQHDERAAGLIRSGAITPDAFVQADAKVRQALDQALPGMGDNVADRLIAHVGEGSEKLFAYLGRNPTALSALQGKLLADNTGLQAMLYLGELKAQKVGPMNQRRTSAPRPGTRLKGDASASGKGGALLRKYKAAEGNAGLRVRLKREAKAAGVDTSNW